MRSALALGASALAALAGVIASLDGDSDIVPFFMGLTFVGGVAAWGFGAGAAASGPLLGRIAAGGWLFAAAWIGGLLLMYQMACACSGPPQPDEATYLGLTATVYHLAGVYLGGALVTVAAFSRRIG